MTDTDQREGRPMNRREAIQRKTDQREGGQSAPEPAPMDAEGWAIHDWVTKHGYLNAPMSDRARQHIAAQATAIARLDARVRDAAIGFQNAWAENARLNGEVERLTAMLKDANEGAIDWREEAESLEREKAEQAERHRAVDSLRAERWMVAVHNDYRQDGKQRTFWLLTRGHQAIKGEGDTDAEALAEVRKDLASLDQASQINPSLSQARTKPSEDQASPAPETSR